MKHRGRKRREAAAPRIITLRWNRLEHDNFWITEGQVEITSGQFQTVGRGQGRRQNPLLGTRQLKSAPECQLPPCGHPAKQMAEQIKEPTRHSQMYPRQLGRESRSRNHGQMPSGSRTQRHEVKEPNTRGLQKS